MRVGFVKMKIKNNVKENLWGYIFILPMMIFFIGFVVVPLISAIYVSLFESTSSGTQFIGLGNYATLFKDPAFMKSLVNTFLFVIVVVPVSVALSILIAALVAPKNMFLQSFFRAAYYLPVVVSAVSLSLVWNWIYSPINGLANYVLQSLGLKPKLWLADPKIALLSLAFIVITWSLGQPVVLFIASILRIPKTYYEAAEIDGAKKNTIFFRVTLPLLRPTTLYVVVTTTIAAFQTFVIVKLLTSGGPNYATSTIIYQLYNTAFINTNFELASAMGVVLAVIAAIISFVQFKYLSSSVEY